MTMIAQNSKILARPNPECELCGSKGMLLYQNLTDRLFGTAGQWNLRRCPNSRCGLVWLDPMPLPEEIGKAYQTYYTHEDGGGSASGRAVKASPIWRAMRQFYLQLERLTSIPRERERVTGMYLEETPPGKLLEVGCGSGQRLAELRKRGWQVEGQEVDPRAAEFARTRYGVQVHQGELEKLALPDEGFDAIVTNHVIEHVFHPEALLKECRRLLKPGGVLVVITPNINSFGHRHFRENWLSLDPPRHLHLFSTKNLQSLASKAGFTDGRPWTTAANAQVVALGSIDIRMEGAHRLGARPTLLRGAMAVFYQIWAWSVYRFHPDSGEECVLLAIKPL